MKKPRRNYPKEEERKKEGGKEKKGGWKKKEIDGKDGLKEERNWQKHQKHHTEVQVLCE
jgi:hypothetical protein